MPQGRFFTSHVSSTMAKRARKITKPITSRRMHRKTHTIYVRTTGTSFFVLSCFRTRRKEQKKKLMKAIYGEKYYTRYIYKEKGLKRKNNMPAGKSNQLFSCFPEKQNAFGQKVAALQNRGAASPHHALRLPVVRYPPPKKYIRQGNRSPPTYRIRGI